MMKLLHKSGEISKKVKNEWVAHHVVMIGENEYVKEDYVLSVFGTESNSDVEELLTDFSFPEYPTQSQIMYCLRKVEQDFKTYYYINCCVDKRFRIEQNF